MKTFKVVLEMRAECEEDARELLECDLGEKAICPMCGTFKPNTDYTIKSVKAFGI